MNDTPVTPPASGHSCRMCRRRAETNANGYCSDCAKPRTQTCGATRLIERTSTETNNGIVEIVPKPSWCEHNRTEEHVCISPVRDHANVHTCGCGWEWSA